MSKVGTISESVHTGPALWSGSSIDHTVQSRGLWGNTGPESGTDLPAVDTGSSGLWTPPAQGHSESQSGLWGQNGSKGISNAAQEASESSPANGDSVRTKRSAGGGFFFGRPSDSLYSHADIDAQISDRKSLESRGPVTWDEMNPSSMAAVISYGGVNGRENSSCSRLSTTGEDPDATQHQAEGSPISSVRPPPMLASTTGRSMARISSTGPSNVATSAGSKVTPSDGIGWHLPGSLATGLNDSDQSKNIGWLLPGSSAGIVPALSSQRPGDRGQTRPLIPVNKPKVGGYESTDPSTPSAGTAIIVPTACTAPPSSAWDASFALQGLSSGETVYSGNVSENAPPISWNVITGDRK